MDRSGAASGCSISILLLKPNGTLGGSLKLVTFKVSNWCLYTKQFQDKSIGILQIHHQEQQ
jgi:hypothetical protein